jgi:alpha-1,2-mannosyltransferase
VAAIWYALNALCWLGLLRTVQRQIEPQVGQQFAREVTLAAGLLCLPLALDGFLLGGFHVLMVWLLIAGLHRALQGRTWSGGTLLGLAAWVKLLPLAGVAYLVLKRRWRAAGLALLTVVVLDVALSLAAYGWRESYELHCDWFWHDAVGTSERELAEDTNDDEDRITNQSLIVVIRRFVTDRGGFPQLSLARLSPGQLTLTVASVTGGLGLAVLSVLCRPRGFAPPDDAGEISLVTLCTIWFSPVVWSYHFVAAVPALALVLSRQAAARRRWIVIGGWCLALALFGVESARAGGHLLGASLCVGGSLVWSMNEHRSGALALMARMVRETAVMGNPTSSLAPGATADVVAEASASADA